MHSSRRRLAPSPRHDAPPPELVDAVGRFSRASLLVIGDAMLDRYVYGALTPANGDAAPVLAVERELALPGGAANLVRNLTALGAPVAFVSVVGDDQTGSDLTGLVGGQPGVEPWLLVEGSRATTLRTRYVAAGRLVLRADQEETSPIHAKLAERLLRIAHDAMAATSATVLADYGKGVLAGDVPARLIAAAAQARRPVIAAPHAADYARYAGADVMMAVWKANGSAADAAATAESLRSRHGFGAVLLLGAPAGLTLAGADGVRQFPADDAEAAEPAVADAAIATLAAGLATGLGVADAAELASRAARVVARKAETAAVARGADLVAALAAPELAQVAMLPKH
jgi:D-beta-D-heptose 7-phosphate kinase / D-beta-D-heptose 1-phosphate adenosyltransferase